MSGDPARVRNHWANDINLPHDSTQCRLKNLRPLYAYAHATNSYLNLYPVIKRQAEELEMSFRCHFVPFDKEKFIRKNFYMCLTNDPTYLMETVNLYPPIYDSEGNALPSTEPDQSNVSLWTDQFSSINQIARE